MVVKPVKVAAGLVFKDGKLLIAKRPENSHLGGMWEFPGGKLEFGESYEICLKREIKEELGVKLKLVMSLKRFYTVILKRQSLLNSLFVACLAESRKQFNAQNFNGLIVEILRDIIFQQQILR